MSAVMEEEIKRWTARPVVRRTTRFHHDAQRRAVVEHARERGSVEPPALDDACIGIGEGEFEHVLGEVATVEMATLFGVACMADSSRDPVSGSS